MVPIDKIDDTDSISIDGTVLSFVVHKLYSHSHSVKYPYVVIEISESVIVRSSSKKHFISVVLASKHT